MAPVVSSAQNQPFIDEPVKVQPAWYKLFECIFRARRVGATLYAATHPHAQTRTLSPPNHRASAQSGDASYLYAPGRNPGAAITGNHSAHAHRCVLSSGRSPQSRL